MAQERARHLFIDGAAQAPTLDQTVRGFIGKLDPENDQHVQTLRALYLGLAIELDAQFGRSVDRMTESVDLMPTVLEWAGS